MDAIWQGQAIIEKMADFVGWLSQGRWQIVSAHTVDTLHAEIYELERSLANAPTRPTHAIGNSKALEPITEQQKIVDLAG